MIKIPVLDTIRSAYGFTFNQLGAIIGLIWIPQLIASLGSYLTSMPFNARIASGVSAEAAGSERVLMLAGDIGAVLMFAVIAVVVTRQALGLRKGPALFYFSFGMPELRIFGAAISLGMLATLFLFGQLLLVSVLRGIGGPAGPLLSGLAALVGFGALIYALVRLSFLVVPSSVQNEDYGIERSWILTRGNFWRIVVVGLACVGPVTLLALLPTLLTLGPLPADLNLGDPEALARIQDLQTRAMAESMPLRLGLAFALAPFNFGLSLGASAAVYKVLSAKPAIQDSGTST